MHQKEGISGFREEKKTEVGGEYSDSSKVSQVTEHTMR